MAITIEDKIEKRRVISESAIQRINKKILELKSSAAEYEGELRSIRKECPHPIKDRKPASTNGMKKCTLCNETFI